MNTTTKRNVIRIIILASVCVISAVAFLDVTVIKSGVTASLLRIMHITLEAPAIFGAFHLCMLALCIALAVVSFFLTRKVTSEQLESAIFAFGIFFLIIEVLKQLYYLAILFPGRYNFGILPLQFCSYVIYLYILIPFLPQGKFKDALYAFSALYQTVGGCIVMVYPRLYPEVFLSVHTVLDGVYYVGVPRLDKYRRYRLCLGSQLKTILPNHDAGFALFQHSSRDSYTPRGF